jgi:transposase-like protein
MTIVDKDFKKSIIQRMMPPRSESVISLAKETGLSEAALYRWKKGAKAKGFAMPSGKTPAERWSTQDKFSIVLETATMSEIELAKYARSKGLFTEDIQAWRDACMKANGGVAQLTNQLHKHIREKDHHIKKLTQELRRKEAALAETAALLVLRKKANAIWGDNEDE